MMDDDKFISFSVYRMLLISQHVRVQGKWWRLEYAWVRVRVRVRVRVVAVTTCMWVNRTSLTVSCIIYTTINIILMTTKPIIYCCYSEPNINLYWRSYFRQHPNYACGSTLLLSSLLGITLLITWIISTRLAKNFFQTSRFSALQ
jgi:hypothetical protein